MTLFPQIDTGYYDADDRTVHDMVEYYYASAIQINQSFWSEADIDHRFCAGDQTLWNDVYGNLPAFRRRQFNFNRIRRVVNMITGYQRQHRFSTIVTSDDERAEQGADQFSKLLIKENRRSNCLEAISDAFEGAVIGGMNLLMCWMDYREDPVNGDIKVDNVNYNEYLIDPFFKKLDLSDCRFLWTRKWMGKEDIKSVLPDMQDEISSMYARGWRDGKFQFQPEAYNYAMQDLMSYDEFYYMDYRKRKLLVDMNTGETLEWKHDSMLAERFIAMHPQLREIEQTIPTVKLAILVNGRTMYHGANPMGIDRYPAAVAAGYYSPQIPQFPWRVQGVVRGLRDAQYLYNRRKIIELDILESQINSGIIYKEDSLINPKDAFLQGQGRALGLKKEADMGDVQIIPPPGIQGSMMQLSESLSREIMEISGVNEELLGSAVDDKAGVLSMLRQGAGLTTLQKLFDQLNFTQKQLGHIYLELIQANYGPGKVKRLINEEPAPEFYSGVFSKYDCVVEEGLNTSTQRQMQFAQLLQLRSLDIPVPIEVLIETSTLQDKKKLIEGIQNEQQRMAQMEEEKHQYAIAFQDAQIKGMQAKATADEGLGIERITRVEENRALAIERISEAQNQNSLAVYNELRAAKELEEMDINHVDKLMRLVHDLEMEKKQNEREELQKGEEATASAASAVASKSN